MTFDLAVPCISKEKEEIEKRGYVQLRRQYGKNVKEWEGKTVSRDAKISKEKKESERGSGERDK